MRDQAAALAASKARCRTAYFAARKADASLSTLWDRWYAETLTVVQDQPASAGAEMFRRQAIMFEIAADRTRWPKMRL